MAQALARQAGLSVLLVDDFRLAIQQVTTPAEQPGIHYFLAHPTIWQKPPEALCEGSIAVGEAMTRPLSAVIAHHVFVEGTGPVIIEGDGIVPALAATRSLPNFHATPTPLNNQVRSVFLVEPDEEVVARNMHLRGRGFAQFSSKEQQTQIRANWLYGQWLRRQADHYNLPVVEPRPWETLVERVWRAIAF